ncbi:MAG: VOC family protein, partial [Pseudomonadota bacterium]
NQTFIELLEVDRVEAVKRPAPPAFPWAAAQRDYLAERGTGMSMLVFAGSDAVADAAEFANFGGWAPFQFGRQATLPTGETVPVSFRLAFSTPPGLAPLAFFSCHNEFPENFWKPDFQSHANGTRGIREIVIAVEDPGAEQAALARLTGSVPETRDGGLRFPLANGQAVSLVSVSHAEELTGQSVTPPAFAAVIMDGPPQPPLTLGSLTLLWPGS